MVVADQLMASIQADEPFMLGANALGDSLTIGPSAEPVVPRSPASAPTTDAAAVIEGVSGVTADQETCSVAN